MVCSVCGTRPARRACPALNRKICSVCCGTKRQREINCPSDCQFLVTAQAHPAAVVRKQQEDDLRMFIPTVRDLNERQEELMSRVLLLIRGHRGDPLLRTTDDDVQAAAGALAATYETTSRGVIYQERPASLPAQRLVADLEPALTQLTASATSSLLADLAIVFRAIERGARDARKSLPGGTTAYLDVLQRLIAPTDPAAAPQAPPETTRTPLIVRP